MCIGFCAQVLPILPTLDSFLLCKEHMPNCQPTTQTSHLCTQLCPSSCYCSWIHLLKLCLSRSYELSFSFEHIFLSSLWLLRPATLTVLFGIRYQRVTLTFLDKEEKIKQRWIVFIKKMVLTGAIQIEGRRSRKGKKEKSRRKKKGELLRKLGFSLTFSAGCILTFCYFYRPFTTVQGVNRNLLNAFKIHFTCCCGCFLV